ncbi:uncharacterized protein MONOS_7889 [Monocercomonoides exilis]|uniref:uncharacterized protein n=1 Tax=Monocercomonoides exilis TaxID=2049356 RepID=UPI00355A7E25|nr:hypothetical protein MONOS_7889 [Monocercomonoides exilis]|eukprot:MONOS_7889.1-p1 / transcript=MONOS_7889.1 / gene=MONOS_7889 / organism=Monocercomonoides_exilis_PA203 / gene_product=unspecified product / transcript_product=unspecified product / location=Mono_scaffold00282:36636-37373(+) / protein_length=165 / sequence_SO=supercontig / SO=protein_coding / is_pseudo=false
MQMEQKDSQYDFINLTKDGERVRAMITQLIEDKLIWRCLQPSRDIAKVPYFLGEAILKFRHIYNSYSAFMSAGGLSEERAFVFKADVFEATFDILRMDGVVKIDNEQDRIRFIFALAGELSQIENEEAKSTCSALVGLLLRLGQEYKTWKEIEKKVPDFSNQES